MTKNELEDLLNQYETLIYSLCIRLTQNKEDAEDLFQDVWLFACEKMTWIDVGKNPKSYLIGKTLLLWKNKKRRFARRNKIAPQIQLYDETQNEAVPADSLQPEEMMLQKEKAACLNKEIQKLSDKYREVIELYYSMDLKTSEIADILRIPQGTVESRLYKARKLLKEKMEECGYEF